MSENFFIVGAGGHARSLISLIENSNHKISGIYDESYRDFSFKKVCEILVVGNINHIKNNDKLILAIGDNKPRASVYFDFHENIYSENLIHPLAKIEKKVKIGRSNQIFANSYINGYCEIGENNIINTGSIIEHEVILGNHNHVSVGVVLAGRVTIGNFCFIGAGAVIIDNVSICNNVIIGANAVVVKNIDDPGTYVGNPAKKLK